MQYGWTCDSDSVCVCVCVGVKIVLYLARLPYVQCVQCAYIPCGRHQAGLEAVNLEPPTFLDGKTLQHTQAKTVSSCSSLYGVHSLNCPPSLPSFLPPFPLSCIIPLCSLLHLYHLSLSYTPLFFTLSLSLSLSLSLHSHTFTHILSLSLSLSLLLPPSLSLDITSLKIVYRCTHEYISSAKPAILAC